MVRSEETVAHRHPRSLVPARPLASDICMADEPEKRRHLCFELSPFSVLRYGIGGVGTGATPQMADAHGGRGGVGMSSPFPCLDGEQLGSVAGLQVIQAPVKVSLLG